MAKLLTSFYIKLIFNDYGIIYLYWRRLMCHTGGPAHSFFSLREEIIQSFEIRKKMDLNLL